MLEAKQRSLGNLKPPFKPGQPEPPGVGRPRSDGPATKTLRKQLRKRFPNDPQGRRFIQLMIEGLVKQAIKGNVYAAGLIFERLEDRMPMPVEGDLPCVINDVVQPNKSRYPEIDKNSLLLRDSPHRRELMGRLTLAMKRSLPRDRKTPRPFVRNTGCTSRWTACVALDSGLGRGPQTWGSTRRILLGRGRAGSPAGSVFRNMTCEECRRHMCTDHLLSKLRCAECRQIKIERFYRLAAEATLVAVFAIFGWLLAVTPSE